MAKGKLVLLGSGETAPGMTKVHRELLSGLGEVRAVNLDTPYGFQLNVPQMTQKLVDYFKVSLQTDLKPLSFTNYEKASGVERELFRQSVREANYVFAGPGSPSYALAQWKGLDLQEDLLHVIDNGGVVCFSSAAALTLGAFTAPIYEIYKAGAEPYWLEGLNLMGLLGINCAVIPHFNNAEGQDYDTSCCYLGEERLNILERKLTQHVPILGVDEHTAILINQEENSVLVNGKGNAYWRFNGLLRMLENDQFIPFESIINEQTATEFINQETITQPLGSRSSIDLAKLTEHGGSVGTSALAELVHRSMAFESSNLLINGMLRLRAVAREKGNFQIADEIRELLTEAQVKIEDGPNGTFWSIKSI